MNEHPMKRKVRKVFIIVYMAVTHPIELARIVRYAWEYAKNQPQEEP